MGDRLPTTQMLTSCLFSETLVFPFESAATLSMLPAAAPHREPPSLLSLLSPERFHGYVPFVFGSVFSKVFVKLQSDHFLRNYFRRRAAAAAADANPDVDNNSNLDESRGEEDQEEQAEEEEERQRRAAERYYEVGEDGEEWYYDDEEENDAWAEEDELDTKYYGLFGTLCKELFIGGVNGTLGGLVTAPFSVLYLRCRVWGTSEGLFNPANWRNVRTGEGGWKGVLSCLTGGMMAHMLWSACFGGLFAGIYRTLGQMYYFRSRLFYRVLLLGAISGITVTVLCSPLDVARLRLQLQAQPMAQEWIRAGLLDSTNNLKGCLRWLVEREGWQSLFPALGRRVIVNPIRFMTTLLVVEMWPLMESFVNNWYHTS
ncbi:hypothetical protein QOT17_011204 [Balamuthia mandrillaris]